MGNSIITPCFRSENSYSSAVKLIYYGGATRVLTGKHLAGEIMFRFPDHMVCHADSFFIGRPIPALAIGDELIRGQTYFLLPLDRLTGTVLSRLLCGSSKIRPENSRVAPVRFRECPFEYMKGSDGRVLIKVVPEFITRLISMDNDCSGDGSSFLCNTPELQKCYDELVGSKDRVWSPKLETISEYKMRFSPCRFLGLEWKQDVES